MSLSLKQYNTFHIEAQANNIQEYSNEYELIQIFSSLNERFMVIGKGSNLLFTKDFDGTILISNNHNIEILEQIDSTVFVRAGAGLEWDEFVLWCANKGFWGVENLSAIPGTVGASVVQNIGAYGVEVSEVVDSVKVFNPGDHKSFWLKKEELDFGYRESVFKNRLSNLIVLEVTYKLSINPLPRLNYADLIKYFEINPASIPIKITEIRDAIVDIRNRKLPDPSILGNGGSFFKNPVVPIQKYHSLKEKYQNIPCYPIDNSFVKVPAGWLIDTAGWKGFRQGDAGVHENQALVLVNYGLASGSDILELSERIMKSVQDIFGISLEREVILV